MKLAAAEAKIIIVERSSMGLARIVADMGGEQHDFSVLYTNSQPVVISSSIVDALISGQGDLAQQLSALFTAVYFFHRTEIEARLNEA